MRRMSVIGSAGWRYRRVVGSRRDHARAFTLIELLVVVVIVLLLIGMFPIALDRLVPARRFALEARQFQLQLRELQDESIATRTVVRVVPQGTRYAVLRTGSAAPLDVLLPRSITLLLRSEGDRRDMAELKLFPDGSSTGGIFELIDQNRRAEISVSALTGRVRMRGHSP